MYELFEAVDSKDSPTLGIRILERWDVGFVGSTFVRGFGDEARANISSLDSSASVRFPKADAASQREGWARNNTSQTNEISNAQRRLKDFRFRALLQEKLTIFTLAGGDLPKSARSTRDYVPAYLDHVSYTSLPATALSYRRSPVEVLRHIGPIRPIRSLAPYDHGVKP
jgi:hypothetical protein